VLEGIGQLDINILVSILRIREGSKPSSPNSKSTVSESKTSVEVKPPGKSASDAKLKLGSKGT
jgi:hypothetical protein